MVLKLLPQQPPEGIAVPVIGAGGLQSLDFGQGGGLEFLCVVGRCGIYQGQVTTDDEVLEDGLLIREVFLQGGE